MAHHTVVKAHTKKGETNHQRPNRADVTGAETDNLKKTNVTPLPLHGFSFYCKQVDFVVVVVSFAVE